MFFHDDIFRSSPRPIRSSRPASSPIKNLAAFTLVELLVVIGIIALLISILLPALQSARRAANAVKCATSLREIGRSAMMYSNDYRGYIPPGQIKTLTYRFKFGDIGTSVYWQSFLQEYATKAMIGSGTAVDMAASQKTVFWGCPTFSAYGAGSIWAQSGYGWNVYPEYTADSPGINVNLPASSSSFITVNPFSPMDSSKWVGKWYKFNIYQRHGAERMLAADGPFWEVLAYGPNTDLSNSIPGQVNPGDNAITESSGADGAHQVYVDFYRHGKYPSLKASDEFSPDGGKVAYNILFCDGHVAMSTARSDAYRSLRMRFPG